MSAGNERNLVLLLGTADIPPGFALLLGKAGFKCQGALGLDEGLDVVGLHKPSLAVVSLELEGRRFAGHEFVRRLRAKPVIAALPVILISWDRGEAVIGLEAGADVFLVNPGQAELLARVRALMRRVKEYSRLVAKASYLDLGRIRINLTERQVLVDGLPLRLSPKEFRLLVVLAEAKGGVVSQRELYRKAWDEEPAVGSPATVRVHLGRIRRKLERAGLPGCPDSPIVVVPTRGYRFVCPT